MKKYYFLNKAKKEADKVFNAIEKFRHVIKIDNYYIIIDSPTYSKEYFDLCQDENSGIKRVYTTSYKFEYGYKDIKEAEKVADKKNQLYGGKWHVIYNDEMKLNIIVAEKYIINHKCKSLYKTK